MTTGPRIYHRKPQRAPFFAWGQRKRVRFAARAGAVVFLGLTIGHALALGGHLDYEGSPWLKLPGKVAGIAGFAAEDIKIQGLVHQEPETVLSAIGVTPGGSLISFNAADAGAKLEKLDWVQSAEVKWLFPNQLEIAVVERVPFAIWQRGSEYHVIDKTGATMSGIPSSAFVGLPLVTGGEAQTAAAELINELSANPALLSQVKAAARVGGRRWTLYLDSGVTILLPEANWIDALAKLRKLDETQQLLSKGIRSVDFRVTGRISVAVAEVIADAGVE
ncbi:MAG: cell division protein FtsQ/DivIB [Rhizobiales bacterium]|nr:cell division protein FtsQ/DivIB [Hyphomicrobiales bacterium]